MRIVTIIPARYASTRFEGKPLARISGKTMIQRVLERAGKADCVTDVAVATDDLRIHDAVREFGGKAILTSQENRSGTDRVGEAVKELGLADDDIVINVQGDQPLLDPRCLDEVIHPFLTERDIKMSTLAYAITREEEITNPQDVKVAFDSRGFALYFSRSPIPFGRDPEHSFKTYKHLGIYAYSVEFLEIFRNLPEGRLERIEKLEQLRALEHGHQIRVVVSEFDSPEVDLPGDIPMIEKLLAQGPAHKDQARDEPG